MANLTSTEIVAFLSEPGRDVIIATVNPAGQPHAVPVWYTVDGGDVVISTGHESVKARNLKANPRIALCVSQPDGPIMFVSVQGEAVEITETSEKRRLVDAIWRKYESDSTTPTDADLQNSYVVRVKASNSVGVRY